MPYSTRYSATSQIGHTLTSFHLGHTLTSFHSTSTHRSKTYEPCGLTPFLWIEFDYIWYGKSHNDPKVTAKISSSYLHFLPRYDCHRPTERQTYTPTSTFMIMTYRRKNFSGHSNEKSLTAAVPLRP